MEAAITRGTDRGSGSDRDLADLRMRWIFVDGLHIYPAPKGSESAEAELSAAAGVYRNAAASRRWLRQLANRTTCSSGSVRRGDKVIRTSSRSYRVSRPPTNDGFRPILPGRTSDGQASRALPTRRRAGRSRIEAPGTAQGGRSALKPRLEKYDHRGAICQSTSLSAP